jgi:hypothetical protein
MIRSQFKLALILVAVLMVVSLGAKAIGALQPPNPALRGFVEGCEGQPQPCWYGIVPGVTTLEEANILNDLDCTPGQGSMNARFGTYLRYSCNAQPPIYQIDIAYPFDMSGPTITSITVWTTDLYVGDFIKGAGLPQKIDIDLFSYGGMHLLFGKDISIYVNEQMGAIKLRTKLINYTLGRVNTNYLSDWKGFVPYWRYCQLEMESHEC